MLIIHLSFLCIDPEKVFNPKAVDNVVLVWGPPKVPNGEITGIITVQYNIPALNTRHYRQSGNEEEVEDSLML